uniref:Deltamethrin resistance protein prag01 domain-containing protein n=1 Tax=Glossina pallidipes TaxID=7398 RepID=A0A1B0AI05_GLOPL
MKKLEIIFANKLARFLSGNKNEIGPNERTSNFQKNMRRVDLRKKFSDAMRSNCVKTFSRTASKRPRSLTSTPEAHCSLFTPNVPYGAAETTVLLEVDVVETSKSSREPHTRRCKAGLMLLFKACCKYCAASIASSLPSGVFKLGFSTGVLSRALYHGVDKKVTMNDLPVPSGDWQEQHARQNTVYNTYLIVGVLALVGTIGLVKSTGVIELNYYPPKSID